MWRVDYLAYITKINTEWSCEKGKDPRDVFRKGDPLVVLAGTVLEEVGHAVSLRIENMLDNTTVFFFVCSEGGGIKNYRKQFTVLKNVLSK